MTSLLRSTIDKFEKADPVSSVAVQCNRVRSKSFRYKCAEFGLSLHQEKESDERNKRFTIILFKNLI